MKKLNKIFAVLVALAMMATLCVSMAFATNETTNGDDALLVKYLDVANGVTAPTKEYTFNWVANASGTISQADADAVKPTNVKLTPATATNFNGDENTVAAKVAVADLFKNGEKYKFTKPGEYIYTVSEVIPDTAVNYIVKDGNETWTYDPATYTVRIYVDKDLNITQITVQDNSKTAGDKEDATKDPTVVNQETQTEDYRAQGLTFENKYTKTLVDEESEDGVLAVEKLVTGTYGDKTQKFPFTIVLTAPTAEDATAAIEYKVAGVAQDATAFANGTKTISGEIANGEKIVFTKLPAGTTYTVTETLKIEDAEAFANAGKYTPSVTGATAASTPAKGANLSTVAQDVDDAQDAANKVTYTNAFDDSSVTPTGILINNLPYIVLALVAIGGLVAYVVVRRRQADEA